VSGFSADLEPSVLDFDDEKVIAQPDIEVTREPVRGADIPAMLIKLRYTDRGGISKGILDAQVKGLFQRTGYKTSLATSFVPVNVLWRWERLRTEATGDRELYIPVVAGGPYQGLRYSGSAYPEPLYQPNADTLAKMPNQIWVYTVAVTSARNTMSDAEGAQVVTLLKQAIVNMYGSGASLSARATQRGCPLSVFDKPVVVPDAMKTGAVALALLIAYNMISPHIGSERL